MKKIIVTLAFFFFLLKLASSQTFWAQSIGGNNVDEVMDICKDNSNSIISAGYFTNTADFGTAISLTSASVGIPDIFISKSTSAGVVQWAVRAGGTGSDRALSVASDAAGNIYITGFYYGTAIFGSFTISSANGSQDVFIAKLNSSGIFQWAVSAGGNMGDIGNSIALDGNGNVIITGQYEGTSTFGTSVITSVINPSTGSSSFDIFTAKYDNNGNFIWVRDGNAKYTDRGLDVATDANNNIFVCGQFSDTISFGNTYNNSVMNSIFLIKYDGNGNEVWFRKASGSYSIAYALTIDNSQNVYLTGDFEGTLAFFGTPNNFLNDTYSKRVFLAKYSNAGNFIWAQAESSNNYISSKGVSLDANNDPYIAGEFRCTLNKFADIFGQGTFNSVGYQDIFTIKYNAAGQRAWMRNFGGPLNDKMHGIIIPQLNKPVIAGSYEDKIFWPLDNITITTNSSTNWQISLNTSYCNEPTYGSYFGMQGEGYSDGFLTQAVDYNREPYDYYRRPAGNSCLRDFVGGCIDDLSSLYSCPDTLTFCGVGYLLANPMTGINATSYGPYYNYQWSSSPVDTFYIDTVYTSGSYSIIMSTIDGCYTSTDTVYAQINPVPQAPTITDDHGVNFQQPPYGLPIIVCAPDTILLEAGNINGNQVSWYYSPNAFLSNNDSIYVDSSGIYKVVLTNQFGCTNYNYVLVQLDDTLPPIIPISNIPDTIVACYGDLIQLMVVDSITGLNGLFINMMSTWNSNPPLSITSPPNYLHGVFTAQNSGTYIIKDTIMLYNVCDTVYYTFQDTFHLIVNPKPTLALSVNGPNFLCQGDTILLVVNVTPGNTSNNTVITGNQNNDTIIVTQPGSYLVSSTITDTITGCSSQYYINHPVQIPVNPVLSLLPSSGLICPNDSVLISCNTAGTNYDWIGPTGLLPFNTSSIYSTMPGFYHCVVTDNYGCMLTSNTVELKQYNTPYLLAQPSNIVCFGQTVTLQVMTNDTTLIQWLPPLSGGGTTQVVSQTGTYSCNVTMCGITTLCSINVVVSQAVAQITGTATICPGDSALLVANPGMYSYQWSPGSSANDSVYVQPGTYTLTTYDVNNCSDSATFTVALNSSTIPPIVNDTTICEGAFAVLTAFTSYPNVEWFASETSGTPLFVGNPFTPQLFVTDTLWVWAFDTALVCNSIRVPVIVTIIPSPQLPAISADTLLCFGDTLSFSTTFISNATYNWSGPNLFTSSLQNPFIANVTAVNSGTYTLIVTEGICSSPPASINVNVITPAVITVQGLSTYCQGDSIILFVSNPDTNVIYYWNGQAGFNATGAVIIIHPADTTNTGTYSVYSSQEGCESLSDSVSVFVNPLAPVAEAASNRTFCEGDTLFLFASINGNQTVTYNWTGPDGFSSGLQNPYIINATVANSGIYSVSTGSNGCPGSPSYLNILVYPSPVFTLGPDTTLCSYNNYLLQPTGTFSSYLWNDNSSNSNLLASSIGLYWLTVSDHYGCQYTDSANVSLIDCNAQLLNTFSPNRDGVNDLFTFKDRNFKYVHCIIFNRWGQILYEWTDVNGGWDGTNRNTGMDVPEGTYYYLLEVQDYEGKPQTVNGFLQLFR